MLVVNRVVVNGMARIKAVAITLIAVFLAVGFLFAVLEAGLAVAKINTKSNTRFIPAKGTTYIPNAYYRHTKEGFSEGHFNSHGFRDYERTYQKPANTFRILVFGDSYVEALQVPLADTFPAVLEKRLNEHASSMRFEVLSLGQSGFGTADEYMRYLNFGVEYSPDLVLLAFLTANDIHDNSKFLNRETVAFYFVFDEHRNLVLDRSIMDEYQNSLSLPKRLFQKIKQHSYVANLISERLFLFRLQLRDRYFDAHFLGNAKAAEHAQLDEFSDLNIYLSDLSPHWRDAFEVTKGVILKFRESVEERGTRFILVTLSNAEQVHPQKADRLNKQYGVSFDYDQPDRMLDEFARQKGITFLKLMPRFREYHRKTGINLHGFGPPYGGHWNENGHRLAADEIFKFLRDKHLVPLDG
jgi:hypothetical protein